MLVPVVIAALASAVTVTSPSTTWRPACVTGRHCEMSRPSAVGGSVTVPCGSGRLWSDAIPSTTGAWQLNATYHYYVDKGLAAALASMLRGMSLIEFGSGMGCYTASLLDSGKMAAVQGYDGAPTIADISSGFVLHADLTTELHLGCADAVMSLEMAEHIPPQFEPSVLRNLDVHGARALILSWSSNPRGNGHVNPQKIEYVVERMRALGYELNATATRTLRAAATISWLKTGIMRFDRLRETPHLGGSTSGCPHHSITNPVYARHDGLPQGGHHGGHHSGAKDTPLPTPPVAPPPPPPSFPPHTPGRARHSHRGGGHFPA